MTKDEWYTQLFERLDNSKFRSGFHLKKKDREYVREKGLETIRQHARDFIAKREAPAVIPNDGKQTPMRAILCLLRSMLQQPAVGNVSESGTRCSREEN